LAKGRPNLLPPPAQGIKPTLFIVFPPWAGMETRPYDRTRSARPYDGYWTRADTQVCPYESTHW